MWISADSFGELVSSATFERTVASVVEEKRQEMGAYNVKHAQRYLVSVQYQICMVSVLRFPLTLPKPLD